MPSAGAPSSANGSQTHVIPAISDAVFGTRSYTPGARRACAPQACCRPAHLAAVARSARLRLQVPGAAQGAAAD